MVAGQVILQDGLMMRDPVAQLADGGERCRQILAANALAVLLAGDPVQRLAPKLFVLPAEQGSPEPEGKGGDNLFRRMGLAVASQILQGAPHLLFLLFLQTG